MVIVRAGRLEQQRKQAFLSPRMFKVPSSQASVPPLQQSQADMSGKRKWQEAFKGDASSQAASLAPQHRSPQLTIFYAGAVNVYDNVPENMVRALMTLAAAKSSKPALLNQVELQRSCSSNNNDGFGFLGSSQHSAGATLPKNTNNAAATTTIPATTTSNVVSSPAFSFPVLDTACTSLSLSSGYRPVVEERPSSIVSASPPPAPPAPPPETSAAVTGVSTSSTAPVSAAAAAAAAAGSAALGISPRTRMQMLPAGLPQARRASIQRFLQKRKQKQVNANEDDEEAAAGGIAAAHSGGTDEIKPTTITSPLSTGPPLPSISTAHNAAQVPHFLKRPL